MMPIRDRAGWIYLCCGLAVLLLCFSVVGKGQDQGEATERVMDILIEGVPALKAQIEAYQQARISRIDALAEKYVDVLETRRNEAADKGDLLSVKAFGKEAESVSQLREALTGAAAVIPKMSSEIPELPVLSEDLDSGVIALRGIWNEEYSKVRVEMNKKLMASLKELESELTKARDFEKAEVVLEVRDTFFDELLSSSEEGSPVAGGTAFVSATKEEPFENSIGMRFVPVAIEDEFRKGEIVLFSIWETRVSDYEKFIRDDRDRAWPKPDFDQDDNHPAVNVNWGDAVAFCRWLTEEERKTGRIGENEEYRLPTDFEWSCAARIGAEEDPDDSPGQRSRAGEDVYFWGEEWPPPTGAGNFHGEETVGNPVGEGKTPIPGYNDGFDRTAPVGSFAANEAGLFDLGGNVWEWVNDWMDPGVRKNRVARGASWEDSRDILLRVSRRGSRAPLIRHTYYGFRVVLAKGSDL